MYSLHVYEARCICVWRSCESLLTQKKQRRHYHDVSWLSWLDSKTSRRRTSCISVAPKNYLFLSSFFSIHFFLFTFFSLNFYSSVFFFLFPSFSYFLNFSSLYEIHPLNVRNRFCKLYLHCKHLWSGPARLLGGGAALLSLSVHTCVRIRNVTVLSYHGFTLYSLRGWPFSVTGILSWASLTGIVHEFKE